MGDSIRFTLGLMAKGLKDSIKGLYLQTVAGQGVLPPGAKYLNSKKKEKRKISPRNYLPCKGAAPTLLRYSLQTISPEQQMYMYLSVLASIYTYKYWKSIHLISVPVGIVNVFIQSWQVSPLYSKNHAFT
jgi:hypothetical protein